MYVFLASVMVASQFVGVASHAYLSNPISRNAVGRIENGLCSWWGTDIRCFGCAHCVNQPEPTTGCGISQGSTLGDPDTPWFFGPAEANGGYNYGYALTKYKTTYTQGQVVPMEVTVGTFHGGVVEFRIQDVGTNNDPDGSLWASLPVLTVESASPLCDNPAECPYESCVDEKTCAALPLSPYGAHLDYKYSVNVRLPETLTCEHCVLQWRYITGNSCANANPPFSHCETSEHFWNCADVEITRSLESSPPSLPVPEPSQSPNAPHSDSPTALPTSEFLDHSWDDSCLCQYEVGCTVDDDCCPGQVCGDYAISTTESRRMCVENPFYQIPGSTCKATNTSPNLDASDFQCESNEDCCNPAAICGEDGMCSFPTTCGRNDVLLTTQRPTATPTVHPTNRPTTAPIATPTQDPVVTPMPTTPVESCRAIVEDPSKWYTAILDVYCQMGCATMISSFPTRCEPGDRSTSRRRFLRSIF